MKNIAIFFLFLSFIFSSCTENASKTGPGISKEIQVTTSIETKKPILADRFGCDQKTKLKDPKFIGYKTETVKKDTTVHCNCSDSEIKKAGYSYTGENPVSVSPIPGSSWDWGAFPWELLLFILALGLLIYFLYWLFSQRPERRMVNETQPPVQQTVHVPFVPEGYDLVKKGYVQLPEGSGYAPAGMSIVSKDQVVIPVNGNYIAPRNQKESLIIQVVPMSETHIFDGGWPNEQKEETPKTE